MLKTLCQGGVMNFVHFPKTGLNITHYHPMKVMESDISYPGKDTRNSGKWAFPIEIIPYMTQIPCTAIYSMVVDDPSATAVCINNTWCVTLGHMYNNLASIKGVNIGLNANIVSHPYFGNRKQVLEDLGRIYASPVPDTMLVSPVDGMVYPKNGIVTINSTYINRDKENKVCAIQIPTTIVSTSNNNEKRDMNTSAFALECIM